MTASSPTFEELLAEGEKEPVEGWGFSWFEGRATEERPSWGYSGILAARMAKVSTALDVQTGGGEVLATIPYPPKTLMATESWPPNLAIAHRNLGPLGGVVVGAADNGPLPFATGTFDLVTSRHPVTRPWDELSRVLKVGGTYLSQGVGSGTNRELIEAMMGPQPEPEAPGAKRALSAAEAAGLTVVDLRYEILRLTFDDVGAIVYFLRKVRWTVPGFTVQAYRDRLAVLHERIQAEGPFVCHARRFLIEARKR